MTKTATKKKKKEAKVKKQPLDGVTYDRIKGARCPRCQMPGGVTNTLPWEDDMRVRYHICRRCGGRFKSMESL